jgi:hypothetical protein
MSAYWHGDIIHRHELDPDSIRVVGNMNNQNKNMPPNSNRAHERAKALIATDVAITQKSFLRCVTSSITNSSDHRFSYLL